MLICKARSFCPSGIDHHQASTAVPQCPNLVAEFRHHPQTAVGDHGIGAQHQEEVGMHNVRHRHRHVVAKHQLTGQLFGHLINAGRRIQVA